MLSLKALTLPSFCWLLAILSFPRLAASSLLSLTLSSQVLLHSDVYMSLNFSPLRRPLELCPPNPVWRHLPDAKNWLIWKDPDAGKDWRQEEKRTTEDEMVGWHHRLDWCGFGWTPGIGDGQGAWRAAAHGVTKSRTRLRDRTELNCLNE